MKRKFRKVPKTKGGVPKKYVSGAKNKKKREAEIKRTAKLYRAGINTCNDESNLKNEG